MDSTLALSGGVAGSFDEQVDRMWGRIGRTNTRVQGWLILMLAHPEIPAHRARASMNVASLLGYHAARRVGRSSGCKVLAMSTTTLKSPSTHGTARPTALVLHSR